jgi:hypothetical protein
VCWNVVRASEHRHQQASLRSLNSTSAPNDLQPGVPPKKSHFRMATCLNTTNIHQRIALAAASYSLKHQTNSWIPLICFGCCFCFPSRVLHGDAPMGGLVSRWVGRTGVRSGVVASGHSGLSVWFVRLLVSVRHPVRSFVRVLCNDRYYRSYRYFPRGQ